MKLSKLLLAVVGATVLLGALVSSATAGRFSSSATNISTAWERMEFTGPFGVTQCRVTLSARLHTATSTKVATLLLGYITDARLATPCIRGEATILTATLPWHVQYSSFSGVLPDISSIRENIIGASFQIREGVLCLSVSTTAQPSTGIFNRDASGRITSVIAGGRIRTSCLGIEGTLSGTSNVPVPAVTVTLI